MSEVASSSSQDRVGAEVLRLLANPLHGRILRAHRSGQMRLRDLHTRVGWPAQTTLRMAAQTLSDVGALKKREVTRMPRGVATELTPTGRSLLKVMGTLEEWLALSPEGSISQDELKAKAALKALADGWACSMICEIVARPLTLTQLDSRIHQHSYPAIERRLARMRGARLFQTADGNGRRGTPYEVSPWLREATAALLLAMRCETRELQGIESIVQAKEIESALLLALPMLPPLSTLNGETVLAMPNRFGESTVNGDKSHAGVHVAIRDGDITCRQVIVTSPFAWALATPDTWLDVLVEGDLDKLRIGGANVELTKEVVRELHKTLFD